MTPRETTIGMALVLGAIGAAWALMQPMPAMPLKAPRSAVVAPAALPTQAEQPVIAFADRTELARVHQRIAEDLIVLDLDALDDLDGAWELAAAWRIKRGAEPLECWVVGLSAFERMQAAARLVVEACSKVVVTDALA